MIRFKTPGTSAPLVAGDGNNVLVIDEDTRLKLQAARREALVAMNPKQITASNEAATNSRNSAGGVQPLKDRDASGVSAQQIQDARRVRAGNQRRQSSAILLRPTSVFHWRLVGSLTSSQRCAE
jgi:hypothetical protein